MSLLPIDIANTLYSPGRRRMMWKQALRLHLRTPAYHLTIPRRIEIEIEILYLWELIIIAQEAGQSTARIIAYPRIYHLHTNQLFPCLESTARTLDRCILHSRMHALQLRIVQIFRDGPQA